MLKNKLNIKNNIELADVEEKITKKKALELFKDETLKNIKPGTYETLKYINKYLFDEIYDFAGITRDVNIAKGNFRFTSYIYI